MLLMLILGVPFAYLFIRKEFPGKKVLDSLIDMPILIPHNTAGIALLTIFAPNYPYRSCLFFFRHNFIDTVWGIVIAMAFVSAPFMIRSAQEAFLSVDPDHGENRPRTSAQQDSKFSDISLCLYLPEAS